MKRTITTLIAGLSLVSGLTAAPGKAEVGKLLESYFEMQQELAADDLDAARKAAASFAEQAETAADPYEMTATARSLADAGDLAVARTEFQGLSTRILALVETVGIEDGSVYLARCPMAFGGNGGTWLQDNETVANPYYGLRMARCGSVIKELGSPAAMGGMDMPMTDKQCCPK